MLETQPYQVLFQNCGKRETQKGINANKWALDLKLTMCFDSKNIRLETYLIREESFRAEMQF